MILSRTVSEVEMIRERLEEVRRNIEEACARSGRNPDDVTLIAVSKTKPESMILEALACGQYVFGENKVQELCRKQQALPDRCQWHMIGHLQRNKVRELIGRTALIHSLDSMRLAEKIEEEAARRGVVVPVLAEINVAQEESKYGISCEDAELFVREAAQLPHVRVSGLMTVAPDVEEAEENRPVFQKLHDLFIDMQCKNIDNVDMQILSMGMTNDYVVAVEEGATMVRVGTGIFGAREYGQAPAEA